MCLSCSCLGTFLVPVQRAHLWAAALPWGCSQVMWLVLVSKFLWKKLMDKLKCADTRTNTPWLHMSHCHRKSALENLGGRALQHIASSCSSRALLLGAAALPASSPHPCSVRGTVARWELNCWWRKQSMGSGKYWFTYGTHTQGKGVCAQHCTHGKEPCTLAYASWMMGKTIF